jgi:hypothetical protein
MIPKRRHLTKVRDKISFRFCVTVVEFVFDLLNAEQRFRLGDMDVPKLLPCRLRGVSQLPF